MTLSEELQWRGFVNQTTLADITDLDSNPRTFYWGVDPSAVSMTIGNFAMAMMVRHFIDHGHKAVLLVGGATGLIGDPDGKAEERNLKTTQEVDTYKAGIVAQYRKVFAGKDFEVVDNYDWFKGLGYLEFLRDVGKHVPMRQMLGREFVQSRLGDDGAGISYAEFSYSLIQGYDFLHLYREKGVTLQVAGADQWGNSIAGVELVRRIAGGEAHIWTGPLVVNKTTGVKFGKTEDGAVWLDPELTSVYKFYQFWLNVDDAGVGDYLKIYTLISREAYDQVMSAFEKDTATRIAQKTLAYEVTKLVHGEAAADSVVRITNVLFGGQSPDQMNSHDIDALKRELPTLRVSAGDSIISTLVSAGLAGSNGEGRRFLQQSAVSVNGVKVTDEFVWSGKDGVAAGSALLKRGKNGYAVVDIA